MGEQLVFNAFISFPQQFEGLPESVPDSRCRHGCLI